MAIPAGKFKAKDGKTVLIIPKDGESPEDAVKRVTTEHGVDASSVEETWEQREAKKGGAAPGSSAPSPRRDDAGAAGKHALSTIDGLFAKKPKINEPPDKNVKPGLSVDELKSKEADVKTRVPM